MEHILKYEIFEFIFYGNNLIEKHLTRKISQWTRYLDFIQNNLLFQHTDQMNFRTAIIILDLVFLRNLKL